MKMVREHPGEWTVREGLNSIVVHWGTWHSCRAYIRRENRKSLGI